MDNVVLNIYDLLPESGTQTQSSSSTPSQSPGGLPGFLSGLLAPLGFGAYHTSIDVRGYRYQFGAGVGICRTSSSATAESNRFVPPNGAYRESIVLGQTWCEQNEINAVIQRMREAKFRGDLYHLANRNCNHFSEVFATALILGGEMLEESGSGKRLDKFPAWVNRLARTGTSFGIDDGNACDVAAEAKLAAGLEGKVGWELKSPSSSTAKKSADAADRSQKKELTEKQKAALAKIRKGSK